MIHSRRVFVGSLAAAGGGTAVWLTADTVAQPASGDAILAHIGREFERLETAFRSRTFRVDDYRAAASNFRLWAAYARDRDDRYRALVGHAIRSHGREALVAAGLEKAHAEHHRLVDPATAATLDAALLRMAEGNVAQRLEQLAGPLDAMHGVLVTRARPTAGAAIARTSSQVEVSVDCDVLSQLCEQWYNEALMWCGLAAIPELAELFGPACESAISAALTYCLAAIEFGC